MGNWSFVNTFLWLVCAGFAGGTGWWLANRLWTRLFG